MEMSRTIKALFQLSDVCAWIVFSLSALSTVTYPLIDFVPSKGPAGFDIFLLSSSCVLVAVGAYALTRRRWFGLLFVVLLPIALGFYSNLFVTVAYLVSAFTVFGTPFVCVLLEARAGVSNNAN